MFTNIQKSCKQIKRVEKSVYCPLALEIKYNKAKYYYVNENSETKFDFAIYLSDNNSIILDREKFKNIKLVNIIFDFLKYDFEYVIAIIPVKMADIIRTIEDNYNVIDLEIFTPGKFLYKKIKINIRQMRCKYE